MRAVTIRRIARISRLRDNSGGFTLVELMVSLVAGLIVTLSVVALAREATTAFYEETRISAVEGSVRSGAERLRQDLARAGYMSTGNIHLARNDSTAVPVGHKIAHLPGGADPSRYTVLNNLQGIRIVRGGSRLPSVDPLLPCTACGAEGTALLSTVNKVDPDMLELSGNFTTDDAYRGKIEGNVITLVAPTALNNYAGDVAVSRLLASGPDPDKAARNAFSPGSLTGALPGNGFIARVVDPRGCQHFVVLSNVVGAAGKVTLTLANPTGGGSPVLTPFQDQSTCGASDQEEVSVAPVQRVRWFLGATQASVATSPTLAAVEAADSKFDLYREVLDAAGGRVAAPGGPQIVAEFAVDLKFGITVDDPTAAAGANQVIYDMDVDGAKIALYTQAASATATGAEGPQRVRSVRFRLATRAALADRTANISLIPTMPQYLSRYCTAAGPLATCKRFARVRTIMSEVALPNQAGMRY